LIEQEEFDGNKPSESSPPRLPPQTAKPPRPLCAPPLTGNDTIKFIFWNETELRAGYRLAVFLLVLSIVVRALLYSAAAMHLPRITGGQIAPAGVLTQELISFLATAAAAAVLAWFEGRRFGDYGLPASAAFKKRFWQGMVWGIAMISAMMLLIRVLGGISFGGFALHGAAVMSYAIEWGLVFLVVGFFEEFAFRGYTLYTLATGVGFWPAATILSAIFGAGHLFNGGEGPVGALSVFVIGMFFCLTLRRTGNLWFAVGLHAAFDWGETYLYSVPDSGLVATGHLLNIPIHGPAWITGGTVGPEGSAAAFIIMAVTALIFNWAFPAKGNPSESTQGSESPQLL
jgi:membrane protease YdiL (CAAX protease family)